MATVHPEVHGDADEHGHPPYLHHHFETPVQQFESDKMGMWLFLATEILLFGGLFCFYSVWRHNHPDVFEYAHQFLNKKFGATNTIVLIFSSFTMAWSIRAIQQGKRVLCAVLLVLTLMCAATFMVIKFFEYKAKIEHGLLWGPRYHPHHEGAEGEAAAATTPGGAVQVPMSQPGAAAQQAPGHDLAAAEANKGSVSATSVARQPQIAESTQEDHTSSIPQQEKPAAGENMGAPPTQIDKTTVADTTAKAGGEAKAGENALKTMVKGQVTAAGTQTPAQPLATGSTQLAATVGPPGVLSEPVPPQFTYPSTVKVEPSKIKPAAIPPAGMADGTVKESEFGPEPKNVQTFFAIYFAMTGLHGIHVLIGMIVITIMLVQVLRGKYNAQYWTPVDLTGLYWHIVDLIWIFLFPLLYLIR